MKQSSPVIRFASSISGICSNVFKHSAIFSCVVLNRMMAVIPVPKALGLMRAA